MGDSRIKDVSSLLSSFFDADKLKQGEKYSEFFASWQDIVGARLAAHSRIVDIDKGLLVIEAEHPGWIQLLQLRQSGIVAEVARKYPELGLRGVMFRLSGQGLRSPAVQKPQEAVPDADDRAAEDAWPSQEEPLAPASDPGSDDPEFQALFSSLKKTMQGKG